MRDTGVGIAPDKRASIFHPFVQADGAISRRFGGTGLALSISLRLVEMMGGALRVESAVGQRSLFEVSLPFRVASAPAQAQEQRSCNCPELRVLVAEDNPINQLVVRKLLERMGHDVEIASDGAASHPPHPQPLFRCDPDGYY